MCLNAIGKFYLATYLTVSQELKIALLILCYEEFENSHLVTDAVVRNIEIIGEASKSISIEIQNKHREIRWRKLRGIRNWIVHDYFDVDREIIWNIIANELTPLKKIITRALASDA